eukprot:1228973-Amorphochlora_amoeboformis.AAC.1
MHDAAMPKACVKHRPLPCSCHFGRGCGLGELGAGNTESGVCYKGACIGKSDNCLNRPKYP